MKSILIPLDKDDFQKFTLIKRAAKKTWKEVLASGISLLQYEIQSKTRKKEQK